MKLLITGVEGYIGCLLAPYLQARGHDIVGVDTGFYRDGWLFSDRSLVPGFPRFLNKDIRQIEAKDLQGIDAVLHLAELSNDPLGENNPELTYQINHQASVRLAQLARGAGVRRFVYTSSCSVRRTSMWPCSSVARAVRSASTISGESFVATSCR